MKHKNIILDFDNTICDLKLEWNFFTTELKQIYNKYEKTEEDGMELLLKQNDYFKKYPESRKEIIDLTLELETNHYRGYKPIKKTIDFIKTLDNKNKYIWSNNCKITIEKILKELNLSSTFNKIVSKDMVEYIKPEIDGFKIINPNMTNLNNWIFIGNNNITDAGAAKNAGIEYLDYRNLS